MGDEWLRVKEIGGVNQPADFLLSAVSDFKKLSVWRKAHGLALKVRYCSGKIRGFDNAALRTQMARAAMSIPTNIVEGGGQTSRKEFARFLSIALNSASELEYHLIVARDLRLLAASDCRGLCDRTIEVRKMLHALRAHVLTTPRLSRGSVPES
jgi:four helix bundle protein